MRQETRGWRIPKVTRVRMINASTGNIELIAGTGEKGNGSDGDPLRCAMNRLHGIFVDADGASLHRR